MVPKNDHRIKTTDGYEEISDEYLIVKSHNYILLRSSPGPSINYTVFLEIKKGAIGKKYFYCMAYNLEENLVVYILESDNESIIIENIKTGKKYYIKITDLRSSTVPYSSIENAYFIGKELVLQYSGKDWSSKENDLHTLKIWTDLD